jgi:hypothetical protein
MFPPLPPTVVNKLEGTIHKSRQGGLAGRIGWKRKSTKQANRGEIFPQKVSKHDPPYPF